MELAIKKLDFPIWEAWAKKVLKNLDEGTRKGVPRGESLPFSSKKTVAAILMTLYPRGIKTTARIGELVKTSSAVIRKWRCEKRFKDTVQEFEIEFVRYVLVNLRNGNFLSTLYSSEMEPIAWSDAALAIFAAEVSNALGMLEDKTLADIIANFRVTMPHVENFIPFETEVQLPEYPPDIGIYEPMLHDLVYTIALALGTRPGKRGRKPCDSVRYRSEWVVREVIYENATKYLAYLLKGIEIDLVNNADRDRILESVRVARDLVQKELSSERGEEKDSST